MSETPERFPVLWPMHGEERKEYERLACPRTVQWEWLAPHENQAQRNHGQSLNRLAERGGLSAFEMLCVVSDQKPTPWLPARLAVPALLAALKEWNAKRAALRKPGAKESP